MKKVFSLLLCIILLCGCANTNNTPPPAETVEPEEIASEIVVLDDNAGQTMITPEDDSWKYTVAERLYNDFCYFYNHMYDDLSQDMYYADNAKRSFGRTYANYNALMALDRIIGISVYKDYLSEDKVEYVRSKREEVKGHNENISPYFGYSKTGLHYIAISFSFQPAFTSVKPACEKIRGDNEEINFMNEMWLDGDATVYDFYVEDLTEKNETIDMKVYVYDDCLSPESRHKQITELSETALKITEKYGREIVPANTTKFKNKSWNAFCYEEYFSHYEIIVKSFGKATLLQNGMPEF